MSLQERGFPIDFFDRIVEDIKTHRVTVDNEQGSYEIIMHLLQNNYRRIAFIANAPYLYITTKRIMGYKRALAEYNVAADESLITYCLHGGMYNDEVEHVLNKLFAGKNKPDALFASTGELTIACMKYCKKHQIKIPEDVALTGFSNLDITDLLCPSLTVVKQPALRMGKIAAHLLIKTIESKRPVTDYEDIVLPAELKIGESSRPKAISI